MCYAIFLKVSRRTWSRDRPNCAFLEWTLPFLCHASPWQTWWCARIFHFSPGGVHSFQGNLLPFLTSPWHMPFLTLSCVGQTLHLASQTWADFMLVNTFQPGVGRTLASAGHAWAKFSNFMPLPLLARRTSCVVRHFQFSFGQSWPLFGHVLTFVARQNQQLLEQCAWRTLRCLCHFPWFFPWRTSSLLYQAWGGLCRCLATFLHSWADFVNPMPFPTLGKLWA